MFPFYDLDWVLLLLAKYHRVNCKNRSRRINFIDTKDAANVNIIVVGGKDFLKRIGYWLYEERRYWIQNNPDIYRTDRKEELIAVQVDRKMSPRSEQ